MKKKLLAFTLCLVLMIAPIATIGVFAGTDDGYTLTGTTYTVTTADGLLAVAAEINKGQLDYNVTLAADIDMADKTWTPIGIKDSAPYKGTFDGANYTIKNLTNVTTAGVGNGLIGAADGGCTVKNLTVTGASFEDKSMVAAIIGYTQKDVATTITVENVHVRSSKIVATASYGYAAAIIGEMGSKKATINNCSIVANITAIRASGVVGGDSASNITGDEGGLEISNTIVDGKIEHKIVGTTGGNKYGASGFFGSNSTMPVKITNCVCLAEMTVSDADKAVIGGVILLINKTKLDVVNCIVSAPLVGDVGDFKTSDTDYPINISNTSVYVADSTDTEISLYGKATAKEGSVTVNGTKLDAAKDAKIPVISNENTLRASVNAIFAGNTVITAQMLDDMLGHVHTYTLEDPSPAFLKTAATCTEPAVYYKSCTCGGVDENATFTSGEGTGHSSSDKWTSDENNHWHVCTSCLEEKSDEGAHTYGDWVVTKEATEKRQGERTKTCTVCGHEVTEKIATVTKDETNAGADSEVVDDKTTGGCGSTVAGMGAVLVVTLGMGVTVLKKRGK